jgi:hypothetical protein
LIVQAKVVSLHWEEQPTAISAATLEVEHENGDRQLFVVPILLMTDRMSGEMKKHRPRPIDNSNCDRP